MAMPWAYNGETREYVPTPCPAVEVNDLANPTEVYGRYICSWIGEKKQLTFLGGPGAVRSKLLEQQMG